MRKMFKRIIAIALVCISAVCPLTASAAWDRLDNDGGGSGDGFTSSATYPYKNIRASIDESASVNKDVIGWLKVPGTNINYPVTHSTQSNNYYVYRDWKGQNYTGINYKNYVDTATYLDYRAKVGESWRNGTSRNLVLYGHNWNNLRTPFVIGDKQGYTMFAQLPSYTDITFAKQNPHIYFSTGENEGIWRVFAVAYCEIDQTFFYNNPNPNTENFDALIKEWQSRSVHNFGVDVDTTDRILTLSTCTRQYAAGNMQRYVVVARLLRDGETEGDTIKVANNADVKQPKF